MKTIWLIGQRVGYFLLVLFLSSFFLALFVKHTQYLQNHEKEVEVEFKKKMKFTTREDILNKLKFLNLRNLSKVLKT